jgi:integrase
VAIKVRKRTQGNGGWEYDISLTLPDGTQIRERKKSPVDSRSGTQRYAEERMSHLRGGTARTGPKVVVPTLAEFAPRYIDGYARANRQAESSVVSKQSHLKNHLIPNLGHKRLSEIGDQDIQLLKAGLAGAANKTVNNILGTLNTLLGLAVEWGIIATQPRIRLLRVKRRDAAFYDFAECDRLIAAAIRVGPDVHLQILLGAEAGFRPGEIRGLHWTSIDFDRRKITIEWAESRGKLKLPKHEKIRRVPMTDAVYAALKAARHMRGPLVFYREDTGGMLTPSTQRKMVIRAQRLANLPDRGPHVLRHTFCSHLAMRGAPTKAIQELAGHEHLSTTQKYMHLSPATLDASIDLLNRREPEGIESKPAKKK